MINHLNKDKIQKLQSNKHISEYTNIFNTYFCRFKVYIEKCVCWQGYCMSLYIFFINNNMCNIITLNILGGVF